MRLPILLALLGLFVHNAYLQSLNCYVPADIMILLDGSDSIQDRDWYKMKEFVQLLIDNFDIARDAIHLGMVVYSSRIGDHIGLNSFKDKNMLKLLAGALNHPKDSTNTAKGIEYVREKFRSDGRPGVPKIAIVITDGSSDNPRNTKLQANAAKNEGIKVLAVGVGGHMFKDELRSIASNPSKVFTSPTFGTLITLVSEIRNMVCQVITTTTTTTTTPKIPTQPPIYVPPPKDMICNVPGDIVFLMDGSDSISDVDFMRQKAFVANMVDNFEISPEAIHVGMVVFSTMIGDVIGLQPAKGKPLLKILAKSLKQPKIGTNTAKGIQRVRKMMAEEGRQFAPKLAVVITDGRSTRPQETIREASLAKAEGITMIAIGVGTEIFQDELRQLASSPTQAFEVRDFSKLGEIINTMRDLICQEIKTTTSTTTTTEMPTPPPSRVPPPDGLICNVPADIGILLDGSDSINDRGFIKEKNFAANLINNLDIGPDTIHASVIVYSTLIGQTIPFTPFKPKTLLTILTRNLKQPKVGTNTAKGINKMREYFRTQGRSNAPKVMVIVTDGRSTRPRETIAEAELAKREGIVVIAVGVGTEIFRDELRQIATNERKLFEVSDFAALQRIIIAIRDLICQVITTTPAIQTTTPLPATTTLTPIPNCDVPAEIMFMLQGSQSTDDQSWADSKRFLSTVVNNMYASPSAHHYGAFVYGSAIGDHVGLQPFKDKFELQNYFNSMMKPTSSGSDVAAALKMMREVFREQGRPSAPKIGVMITNEPTSTRRLTMAETDLAKTEGVKLYTIGVGNLVDRGELLNTATSEKHVMLTPNARSLESILPNLRHLICDDIMTPITTRPPRPSHNFTSLCAGCLYDRGTGYNFFPGDCSKFVQCWENNGYVHGVVKQCPFGEFWKQEELKCVPSIHVHCTMDPCLRAPNGFTYGMEESRCRSYWICVDSHSLGSCCAPGTHYVEGMGCMRGLACNDACPPNGGKIYTPCKKQAHWDRRFYMDDVPQQKLVRHCSPGTIFSKEYCTCIPDMEGLIPVLPGDQCKASAYLPFDVDLEDKSGSNTAVMVRNVTMTPYGSAHFTGNSALTLYKYADMSLGNKLLISFKFKFDRWPDSLDHAGRVVHYEKGETHWRFDIQSKTWTRNITIGGGWNAGRLTRMFRKLMGSTNAQQMNLHMIEIANSPDFKALLYHLGFMPDATNALQILRIIFSGQGSNLINQILQKIGNVHGSEEVRKLLYNLLRIEGMNKWIKDHTGRNHKHAFVNWQRFLNSLNLNEKDWNKGGIPGLNVDHNMGKLIADLWRIFVNEHGMNTRDWKDILKITFNGDKNRHFGIEFLGEIEGVLGRNKTIKDLWFDFLKGRNVSVSIFGNYTHGGEAHKKHPHFLRYIEDLVKSGKGGEWLNYVLGGGKIHTDHGGFTHEGVNNIADIWREYVTDARLDQQSSLHPHLTWTLTGGGTGGQRTEIFIDELRNVLANDTVRNHFLDFLKKYDINLVGTGNGWKLVRGGNQNDVGAWLYWLFTQTGNNHGGSGTSTTITWPWFPGGEGLDGWDIGLGFEWIFGPGGWNNGGRVGITTNGFTTLADLWQLFMAENPLDRNVWGNKLVWTLRSGNNGYKDYFLLLRELRHVLSNEGMIRRWQEFLQKHNYNIVLNNNGWDIVKGGSRNDLAAFITWLFVVVDEMESSTAGADFDWIFGKDWRTGITSTGVQTLAELWTRFIQESNVDVNVWGRVLFWTLRSNTGKPGLQDYISLFREMRHVLADDYMRQLWIEFLQRHNHNIILTNNGWDVVKGGSQNNIGEFIFWLFATVDEIESSGPDADFSWLISGKGLNNLRISITQNGLQSLMNLWDLFMVETNLDKNTWGQYMFWTLRSPSDTMQNQHYVLLLKEMMHLLSDTNIRNLWLQFLAKHNYNIVLVSEGWDIVKGGSTNDASAFIFWLFNIVESIENRSITDIDWIFTPGKQSWERYIRRGFTTTGLHQLVILWEQFLAHVNLDVSAWSNVLYWTHRKTHTGEVTHQDYYLLFQEMRHLLDNDLIRNQFIDFMANSGYNFVLTTVGWEIELGGTRNDIAGFIYWLVTTVDTIMSLTPETVIDWLFITDVSSYTGTSSENKFTLNGIRSLSKLWDIFLARNQEIPKKWGKKLLWTLRNVKGANKVNYVLLLQEMRNILIIGEVKNKWKNLLKAHKCKIASTSNGWDCFCGRNVSKDDTDSFLYWLFKSFGVKEWHHSTRLKLNSRIPFAPSGIKAIARFWRFFISKNNVRKRGWKKYICWSKSKNKNYISLINEMRNILGLSSARRSWLRCMKSKNRHIVLTNEGWDVLSQGYANDNKLWVYWLFTAYDELMSTSNRAQYDWWFAGKGNYSNWRVVRKPTGGHWNRPIGSVVRKFFWEYDEEGWHKRLFTGYPSGWFGLKYGFSKLGQNYIMKLWKEFIARFKQHILSWQNNLIWSDRQDFSESLSEYVDFITEMQILLTNTSCKDDWLKYLKERRIRLSVTENGWDVSDDDHDFDNSEWVSWLLQFPFADSGSSWIGGSSSSGGFSGQRVNSAFGEGWSNMLFGGPSDSHSGESSSGGSSTESLDSILKSLSNGFAGGSGTSSIQDSQEYYSGGFGMGDMFGLLAAEEFLRKKRSTENVVRHKRQAHAPFHYQSLVGNCHGNNPSIDIAANERNVKMILVTDGSNQPGELILPIVQGWNEVTLVYNGRDMHGMVNNWQGEKKTSIPMRGNIQSRPEGISLGYCPKYDGLQGKIDDFAFYECIPLAIQNKIGRS